MWGEKLGARALSYLPAGVTTLLWSIFFGEGAGFGAATYTNDCGGQPYSCHLVYHALFPPQVSLNEFAGNLASLWVDGMYDVGYQFALVVLISLLLVASQLNRDAVKRAFSWPVIFVGCALFAVFGYFYEVHQTLSTGLAHVPLL
jgi:hypothetical protein